MNAEEAERAVTAGMLTASELGLRVDDAVVLHDSNRLAVRLLPCDVLARIAPLAHEGSAALELEVARRLSQAESPVARLEPRVEPRVYVRDGFAITFWTYYEPVRARGLAPREYADALARLHADMRHVDVAVPHFTERVAEAQALVDNPTQTPDLGTEDRYLLRNTLPAMSRAIADRGAEEQLLHGEPHPGNVLSTDRGLLFIDLETCCRGPVEFDVAHAPEEVGRRYSSPDPDLLRDCRILMLAMTATWRWDRDDQLPNGRQRGTEWLMRIRAELDEWDVARVELRR